MWESGGYELDDMLEVVKTRTIVEGHQRLCVFDGETVIGGDEEGEKLVGKSGKRGSKMREELLARGQLGVSSSRRTRE